MYFPFLAEGGEFPSAVLDALRQPLESGVIQVHRSGVAATCPARFQLVVATNSCPCGQYGVAGGRCECAPQAIRRYTRRLSGPLLDRIDIDMPGTWSRGPAAPSPAVLSPLVAALRRGALTLRGYNRLLRVRKIGLWRS